MEQNKGSADIERRFSSHTLPSSDEISKAVHDEDAECVDMQLLDVDFFQDLFKDQKTVAKRKAKHAFDEFAKEEFEFVRCVPALLEDRRPLQNLLAFLSAHAVALHLINWTILPLPRSRFVGGINCSRTSAMISKIPMDITPCRDVLKRPAMQMSLLHTTNEKICVLSGPRRHTIPIKRVTRRGLNNISLRKIYTRNRSNRARSLELRMTKTGESSTQFMRLMAREERNFESYSQLHFRTIGLAFLLKREQTRSLRMKTLLLALSSDSTNRQVANAPHLA